VTVWNSVPCLFELLLDEAAARHASLEALRLIMLSGDFVSLALARRAQTALPRARLVSLGGATEAAIWSIAREIENVDPTWRGLPYGRALRRQEVFVLDPALDHCPAGITGELFIAGAGLAKGYWRNASETRRRFLRHPRWKIRLYRTGDQGRYLENGEIEILGRLDEQVKVNGIRLELGEIEAGLCALPSVRQAWVEARQDDVGGSRIIAFVVTEPGTSAATLSAHATKTLPAAFRPAAYAVLDHFPLTSNGKVDRAALRAMKISAPRNRAAPPENSVERSIAELWSVLLGGVPVGAEDDFFALGGHSLLALKMLQRVRTRFAVDLPLQSILERPTVRGLAVAVNAARVLPPSGLPRRATTELERDSDPGISRPVCGVTQEPGAILLTGATGHLGSALLVELLKRTNDRVYCFVRAGSKAEAAARIMKALQAHKIQTVPMDRIVSIPSDLRRERFGLEPRAFTALATEVRAAYHCAAEVNFLASYEQLAASNVGGVREMIRLAAAAGAVLHHLFSVAVFPYGQDRIRREDEDITRVEALTGGYAQSKWVSERMVWRAISHGLRGVIYRPAQIVTRQTSRPPHDLFEHVVRACKALRAVPDIDTKIDLITSDYAAAAICALSDQESSLGKAFHLVHPEPLCLRDFVALLPAPLPLVPLEAWLALLSKEAEGADDPSLDLVLILAQGLGRADITPPGFDCSGTIAGLRGTGVICPPIDGLI
jgi:thioester reductase-like protein